MYEQVGDIEVNTTDNEKDVERESVEWIFSLVGELEPKPWIVSPKSYDPIEFFHDRTWTFRYWVEGPPEWCAKDFDDHYHEGVSYRTVVRDCLWGVPPEVVVDDKGVKWTRKAVLGPSSGECECPGESEMRNARPCKLCEAQAGEEHGYLYIGDGWYEIVYRTQEYYCLECFETIKTETETELGKRFCSLECRNEALQESQDDE